MAELCRSSFAIAVTLITTKLLTAAFAFGLHSRCSHAHKHDESGVRLHAATLANRNFPHHCNKYFVEPADCLQHSCPILHSRLLLDTSVIYKKKKKKKQKKLLQRMLSQAIVISDGDNDASRFISHGGNDTSRFISHGDNDTARFISDGDNEHIQVHVTTAAG